ncbi:21 kDa seed protein-like [Andrographis paniculata]|uniref:21 kDa seed protein-like n=1 Tax=Andrographis paniculata TaxID=175694 RepID=UPI0021E8517B|nr:21 kDa seed protein-like [Andrographis paniculata]
MMKLFSLFLVLLFIHTFASAASSPVLDTDGEELKPDVEYYISFNDYGPSGGIGLPRGWGRLKCPVSVIQMLQDDIGLPVIMKPVKPSESKILENSTDVYISFPGSLTRCPGGAASWRVEYVESVKKSLVVAGTFVPNPSSYFRIVQDPREINGYVFATCPNISGLQCRKLGLFGVGDQDRLAVNDQPNDLPYKFWFVKKENVGVIQLPK